MKIYKTYTCEIKASGNLDYVKHMRCITHVQNVLRGASMQLQDHYAFKHSGYAQLVSARGMYI